MVFSFFFRMSHFCLFYHNPTSDLPRFLDFEREDLACFFVCVRISSSIVRWDRWAERLASHNTNKTIINFAADCP